MRKRVVSGVLAVILCLLTVLPQMGMTVRDDAAGQQLTLEAPEGEEQENSAPSEGAEEIPVATADPTEREESADDTEAPSVGGMESEETGTEAERPGADASGAEPGATETPEDAPNGSQMPDGSGTDREPEGQGPAGEEEPETGEQPGGNGSGVYTLSEVETIIGDGISLASLRELMPVSVDSGRTVPEDYFKFVLSGLTGYETNSYHDYASLQSNEEGYVVGEWPDSASGTVFAGMFPAVERMTFEALRLHGTIIESIGMVTVTVLGEGGSPTTKDYVYFSPTGSGVSADAMVLPDGVNDTHLFEARYVYASYDITYEVYWDADDISEKWLDNVFGVRRTASTADGMASVDVSIPAGFIGHVYVGDTDDFTADREVYPVDTGYGPYPLGRELTYKQGPLGAEIDAENGPGFYSAAGTYSLGSPDGRVSADQTVRVVLQEKKQYTFHPEFWMNTDYTGKGKRLADDVRQTALTFEKGKSKDEDGVHILVNKNGGYDLVWDFTTTVEGNPAGWLLESLEVNGVGLRLPYMEYNGDGKKVTASTVLPSGGSLFITAEQVDDTNTCEYHLTVLGATQDVVITGGSLRAVGGESQLVLEDSTGTEVEFFFCGPEGQNSQWVKATQSKPVSASKMGDQFHYNAGDSTHHYANVRFKLQTGYEWRDGYAGVADVAFFDQEGIRRPWGTGKEESEIYPDSDGWCYLRLGTGPEYYDRELGNRRLSITAKPARYVIQYLDGTGAAINADMRFGENGVADMPGFLDGNLIQGSWDDKNAVTLDGNHGNYYGIAARTGSYSDARISTTATIHGSVPRDTAETRPAQFQGWVITDAKGNALDKSGAITTDHAQFLTYQPGSALSISDVMGCGSLFNKEERLYVVYLTGLWKARAPSYTYYVTYNETTIDGTERTRIQIENLGNHFDEGDVAAGEKAGKSYSAEDWYAFRRDSFFDLEGAQKLSGLNIVLDTENGQTKELMEGRFRWYKYDDRKNSADHPNQFLWGPVPNGGEVDVWLISNLGTLNVTKEVVSREESELDKPFPFTVTFTLPPDDLGTAGSENTYFRDGDACRAVYTVSDGEGERTLELESLGESRYRGTLSLKNGQTASFVLPGGTEYSITENVDEGYSIVTSGDRGVIRAASGASEAKFTNTPSGIVVKKTQVETTDAMGTEEISTPAALITVGSGDHVKYAISVTNRDEEHSATVTVTDEIPNAVDDDGSRMKLTVNGASVSDGGKYTPDSNTAGTVKWENVTLAPGETRIFSFIVTAPVVYNLNTYINTADVEYKYDNGPFGHLTTNEASLVVVKDWLRIGKVLPLVSRGEAGDRDFVFHITLSDSAGTVSYPYIGLTAESYEGQGFPVPESGMLDFTDGKGEVRLREGQAIALYGIPENTGYTVEEEHAEGFRTSVVRQSTKEETQGSVTSGVISADASDWLIFKNTPIGVRLSKSQRVIRTGDNGQLAAVTPGDKIEYSITVQNIDREMSARDVTITDEVPDGLTVSDITAGGTRTDNSIVWTIPELAAKGEETVSFTAAVPENAAGESFVNTASAVMAGADAVFSNAVTAALQTGSLTIAKSVEEGPEPNEDIFSFAVELTHSADGAPLAGNYPYTSDDGSISGAIASGDTIALRKGETVTIRALPVDTRWTVTETGPFAQDDHGYEGQAPKSGTLTSLEPDGYAAFSNTWYGLYSLTYDGNGNTVGAPPVDESRYREHEIAALRQPADDFDREYAVFLGWSEKKSDAPLASREEAEDAQIIEEVEFPDGDVTVFAVWAADADGDGVPDYEEAAGPVSTPEPGGTPTPVSTPGPGSTPGPSATPEPAATPEPGASPVPSGTPEPSTAPGASATPAPSATPGASATAEPGDTPYPGATPGPGATHEPDQGDGGGTGRDRAPHTADDSSAAFWGGILMTCIVCLAVVTITGRRRYR